ncbi:MAG TPA: methyltransferase domain-containing protein [Acidimicrobiia bacterium]|nr:methyltransferase domain-containing protein [Acidimicrobiia bacterium]
MADAADSPYLLDNRQEEAGDRFDALAALYDPMTIGHFDTIGVGAGWRCLEVGAGGGSVVRHLSERVGAGGRVLATDIEPLYLEPLAELGNVEVARHNAVVDPLPEAEFDLVHARLVLIHIPERLEVLHRLVHTLRPGGWLLIEDGDGTLSMHSSLDPQTDDEHLGNRIREGTLRLMEGRGVDFAFGRQLPRLLRDEGLIHVAADGFVPISEGVRLLERANILQLQEMLLERDVITKEELEHFLGRLDDPGFLLAGPQVISAWGRRPGG